jgi:hypothetical protein
MKRNWDTIRTILIAIEALHTEDSEFYSNSLVEADPEATAYHMLLLLEAKLIIGDYCDAVRLTWDGHEFLDAIKNESVWQKLNASARSKGIELSFTVIKDLAQSLIASLLL